MCSITQSPWKRNRCKVCEQYIKELNGEIIPPITWIAIKSWRAHVMCTNGNEEEQAPSIIISVMTVTPSQKCTLPDRKSSHLSLGLRSKG